MAVVYEIDKSAGCILGKAQGTIEIVDFLNHFLTLQNDEDFYVGINGLYDFREVDHISGHAEDFIPLATTMEDQNIISKQARVAVICNANSSVESLLNGYKLMVTNSLVEYRFFEDEPAARVWLEYIGSE